MPINTQKLNTSTTGAPRRTGVTGQPGRKTLIVEAARNERIVVMGLEVTSNADGSAKLLAGDAAIGSLDLKAGKPTVVQASGEADLGVSLFIECDVPLNGTLHYATAVDAADPTKDTIPRHVSAEIAAKKAETEKHATKPADKAVQPVHVRHTEPKHTEHG